MANIMTRGLVWWFERKTKDKSYATYKQQLEKTGRDVAATFAQSDDGENNRWMLTHVIGMEKWMQSRIKVALGEPLINNDYDVYRPAQDEDWAVLVDMFKATRAESCELCDALAAQNVDGTQVIMHNEFGDLSVKGWLEYILFHAESHAKAQWFILPMWNTA